jgi:hypothetical protein
MLVLAQPLALVSLVVMLVLAQPLVLEPQQQYAAALAQLARQ